MVVTLGCYLMGFMLRAKRGRFVLQRATTPAIRTLIFPQDGVQNRGTWGLVFAKQAATADEACSGSRCQQQAG